MPWHVLDINNNIHKSEKNKNTCSMQSFYISLAHDIVGGGRGRGKGLVGGGGLQLIFLVVGLLPARIYHICKSVGQRVTRI